jgi:ribosomal protein S18 acetylase RimI-like enzyme
MEIKIKIAQKSDVENIIDLYEKHYVSFLKSIKDDKSLFADFSGFQKSLKEKIGLAIEANNYKIIIAEETKNQKMIGFAIASILSPPFYYSEKIKEIGFIDDFYVEVGYRRHGIGKKLCRRLFRWFKQNNINQVELEANLNNSPSLNFWKKMGFLKFRIRMKSTIQKIPEDD